MHDLIKRQGETYKISCQVEKCTRIHLGLDAGPYYFDFLHGACMVFVFFFSTVKLRSCTLFILLSLTRRMEKIRLHAKGIDGCWYSRKN
jgi:hypothetical protein